MGNAFLEQQLKARVDMVENQIQRACQKAGRGREEVLLVAVTKTISVEMAGVLHQMGVTDFGESRPQELWRKASLLPNNIRWHQIGHLQTNKVERTLPLVTMIHSVDSWKLLQALEKEAERLQMNIEVLLEVNASGESNKHGFHPEEMGIIFPRLEGIKNVTVQGLMTMAAYEENSEKCRPTFALLRHLENRFRSLIKAPHQLNHLSMGMSNDFAVAIEEGATMIRLGTILFEGISEVAR